MTYRKNLATFTTWLFAIAKNVHIDYLKGRHIYLPIDAAANLAADGSPAIDAERRSDLSRLASLCADLSERDRELIALRYGADLSNRFIGRMTGLSESNVGTILHRLVKVLRERW
jgi:RNA polymerase sigma-70 factor (ECF subfamily)